MKYPTLEEVEQASRLKLARWYRFLPSPGENHIKDSENLLICFSLELKKESTIMNRIRERFSELGGMNSTISKTIGW